MSLPPPSLSATPDGTPTANVAGFQKSTLLLKVNNWPYSAPVEARGNCVAFYVSIYNFMTAPPWNIMPTGIRFKYDKDFEYAGGVGFPSPSPDIPAFYDPWAIDLTLEGYNQAAYPGTDQSGYKPRNLLGVYRGVSFQRLYLEAYGGFVAPINATYPGRGVTPAAFNRFWVDVLTWFDPSIIFPDVKV